MRASRRRSFNQLYWSSRRNHFVLRRLLTARELASVETPVDQYIYGTYFSPRMYYMIYGFAQTATAFNTVPTPYLHSVRLSSQFERESPRTDEPLKVHLTPGLSMAPTSKARVCSLGPYAVQRWNSSVRAISVGVRRETHCTLRLFSAQRSPPPTRRSGRLRRG